MGLGSDVKAGSAFIEMNLKDSGLIKGLDKIAARAKNIGKTLAGIGAATVGPLLAAATSFAAIGDQFGKMSARLGVGAEELQKWSFAANEAGSSIEAIEKGIAKTATNINEAVNGSTKFEELFKEIGLDVKNLASLDPAEAFEKIGAAIGDVESDSRKLFLTQQLVGGAARELIPLFNLGAEGMEKLRKEADKLGIPLTNEEVKQAEDLTDAFFELKSQLLAVVNVAGSALAPVLLAVIETIKPIIKSVIDWVRANKELIQAVFLTGAGLIGLGAAIFAVGTAFAAVSAIITTTVAAIGGVIAFLASPIGLVVVALTGLTAAFLTSTKTGRALVDSLSSSFTKFADDAKAILGFIFRLLADGDLAKAGEIAMIALNAAFDIGLSSIKIAFEVAWAFIKTTFAKAVGGLHILAIQLFGNIRKTINLAIFGAGAAWDIFAAAGIGAIISVIGFVNKLITAIGGFLGLVDDTESKLAEIDAETAAALEINNDIARDNLRTRVAEAQKVDRDISKETEDAEKGVLDEIAAREAEIEKLKRDAISKNNDIRESALKRIDALRKEADEDAARRAADLNAEELKKKKPDPGDVSTLGATQAAGTFSAAAAQLLGGGNTAEKQLEETKKIKTSNDKIVKNTKNIGGVFIN